MAFINQDRKTSIQSDRLNLKQTPADIWEYGDANTDSTPTLSLKSPWKFSGEFRPPIGIPTFWFSSLPDWAITFDDGSGYDWVDYPEFDNATFKAMLTIWSTAGWMSAHDASQFYVPDLRGMAFQIAGLNAVRMMANGNGYDGGDAGDYDVEMMHGWQAGGYISDNAYYGFVGSPGYASASGVIANNAISYWDKNQQGYAPMIKALDNGTDGPPNLGPKTKPATASIRLIVRFE